MSENKFVGVEETGRADMSYAQLIRINRREGGWVSLLEFANYVENRLTALERGGETKPVNLNPNAKYFCTGCGLSQFETSREQHNKECPDRPAPTAATVERFKVWGHIGYMDDPYAYNHPGSRAVRQKPIGVVVATQYGNGYMINLGGTEYFAISDLYRALVEHNTKSGIWERTNA